LVFAISVVVYISILLIAVFAFRVALRHERQRLEDRFASTVQTLAYEIQEALRAPEADVIALAHMPDLYGLLRAEDNNGYDPVDQVSYETWASRLADIFIAEASAKRNYLQLRYLDETGAERVRVDYNGQQARVVPPEELQNKAHRYYFQETMALQAGEVYLSNVDLNQEHGQIQTPYLPVLRYATPVFDAEGRRRGVLVINIAAEKFLHLDSRIPQWEQATLLVTDQDGYYLHHEADSEKEWGGPDDLNTGQGLRLDYPEAADQILSGQSGQVESANGDYVFYTAVPLAPRYGRSLVVGLAVPRAVMATSVRETIVVFAGVCFLALILAVGVAWSLSKWLSDPLRALGDAADRIAAGDLDTQVPKLGSGEVAHLADDFEKMRQGLKRSREELQRWGEELQARVDARTHQLIVLNRIAQAISSSLNLEEALPSFAYELQQIIPYECLRLAVLEQDGEYVRLIPLKGDLQDAQAGRWQAFLSDSALGWVIQHNRPLRHVSCEKRFAEDDWLLPEDCASILVVPLVVKGKVIGALGLGREAETEFGDEEVALVEQVAAQIATAVENSRLYQESQVARQEMQTYADDLLQLNEQVIALNRLHTHLQATNQDTEAAAILAQVLHDLGAARVAVFLVDEERSSLQGRAAAGLDLHQVQAVRVPTDQDSPLASLLDVKEAVIQSVSEGPVPELASLFDHWVALPIRIRGEPLGLVVVEAQTLAETDFWRIVVRQSASAFLRIRLFNELARANQALVQHQQRLRDLYEISFGSFANRQEMVQQLLERVADMLQVQDAAVGQIVGDEWRAVGVVDRGGFGIQVGDALPLRKVYCERVYQTEQPLIITDASQDEEFRHHPDYVEFGTVSYLGVPLMVRDRVFGVLCTFNRRPRTYKQEDAELLSLLAQRLGYEFERSEWEEEMLATNRQLERLALRAQEASQLKSEFLANMSHELRTPLNAVIGFSQMLRKQVFGTLNEKQAEYVTFILESGQHLLALINDVLDLSRVEAGKMELSRESLSLASVVEEALPGIRPLAEKKRLQVSVDLPEELPLIFADRVRVRQVLHNLLSNAVKFTPEGGSVSLSVHTSRWRDGKAVEGVQLRGLPSAPLADGLWMIVQVADTGIGIPSEDADRIFEPFQQVDSSMSREYQGTGLGLGLARRLATLHGGELWLEWSEPGQGSSFAFALPVASESSVRTETSKEVSAIDSTGPILVIEDSPSSRRLLWELLSQGGYQVIMTGNGEEGLREARESHPAVIVLDLVLPDRDGWELLNELKTDPETWDIPVIVVSFLDERGRGLRLGATDYLVKPVDQTALLTTLARHGFIGQMHRAPVRVLVVDDDPQAVELVATLLSSDGFEVLRAHGGEEGVRMALAEQPDLIILDLMMPDMDGVQVLERLRAEPRGKDIPVFILSARDLTPEERKWVSGEVLAVARKETMHGDELLAAIRRLL